SGEAESIIEILKERFGHPRQQLQRLIQRAKQAEAPNDNKPISVVKFAAEVRNVAIILQTLNEGRHVQDSTILNEFERKLTPIMKNMWAEVICTNPDYTVLDLMMFLNTRAKLALAITPLDGEGPSTSRHKLEEEKRPKFRGKGVFTVTLDNIGIKHPVKPLISREDEEALEIQRRTTKRVGKRFEAGLLWKTPREPMPDSRLQVIRRDQQICLKMARDIRFEQAYIERMKYQIEEKRVLPLNEEDRQLPMTETWYLPHFDVVNPNKPKMRIVLDAAAEVEGVSLNSRLLSGPNLIKLLQNVLMHFRTGEHRFTGDIKDMFPQIFIRKEDQNFQRVMYHGMEYKMTTMTFGATCSPATALYVKDLNALEWSKEYPEARLEITDHHYVDDYLGSHDNEEKAVQLILDVIEVHRRGEFEIRNFLSQLNEVEVPRCLASALMRRGRLELHIFTDASEDAIAAVAYLSCITDHAIHVSFVMAKTNVAPLKAVSIARLELQGALIGSRLATYITTEYKVDICERMFWTDSTIVLQWIKSDSRTYKPFVGNRVGLVKKVIKQTTELSKHLPSEEVLTTLLAEAENIVNSRPLLILSDSGESLTPNHFLKHQKSTLTAGGKFEDTYLILSKEWRKAQPLLIISGRFG
uniref:Reverse transcriptase domain-containing protein n=1 Tax=Phlebotomus papatasi TaxID=29031 RepID=A0A1B0CZG8_PHLPP